ncbi:hypothetical protein HMPREF0322_04702 [Desulfitobacterium hafniense DP7]|uniref:Uncharacterized protein n=1 Tax=Desulfitobacterium hafniense DP7 TaxID=537010 RepID=G9XUP3_DESHA|nr:hypothetical protein HMPREF0322_04702 [Desulfitobacterium hafniense DP7]
MKTHRQNLIINFITCFMSRYSYNDNPILKILHHFIRRHNGQHKLLAETLLEIITKCDKLTIRILVQIV